MIQNTNQTNSIGRKKKEDEDKYTEKNRTQKTPAKHIFALVLIPACAASVASLCVAPYLHSDLAGS